MAGIAVTETGVTETGAALPADRRRDAVVLDTEG
jgi:hypothetical protein